MARAGPAPPADVAVSRRAAPPKAVDHDIRPRKENVQSEHFADWDLCSMPRRPTCAKTGCPPFPRSLVRHVGQDRPLDVLTVSRR